MISNDLPRAITKRLRLEFEGDLEAVLPGWHEDPSSSAKVFIDTLGKAGTMLSKYPQLVRSVVKLLSGVHQLSITCHAVIMVQQIGRRVSV